MGPRDPNRANSVARSDYVWYYLNTLREFSNSQVGRREYLEKGFFGGEWVYGRHA